jgi:hypothetical protein
MKYRARVDNMKAAHQRRPYVRRDRTGPSAGFWAQATDRQPLR